MQKIRDWIIYVSAFCLFNVAWLGWNPPIAAAHADFSMTSPEASAVVSKSVTVSKVQCADTGQKIDLNNANMTDFMDCPGFYPTLAKSIVLEGPFRTVEDVLKIADLSDLQKEMLKNNLEFFTVKDPERPIEMRLPPRPSMRANP